MTPETLLQAAQRPLLIAHIAPDGDAIGSLLGLGWALREAGRQPTLACADPVPSGLRFLPGAGEIVRQSAGEEDLVVALDCADEQRLGAPYGVERIKALPVLNIDHHITNTGFGAARLIDPAAASTAEIVYEMLRRLGWPIGVRTATCLLAGLVSDTRSFRTTNTNAKTLQAAVALVDAGAPLAEINAQLERGLTLGTIRLWARVLSAAQFRDGIIWAEVSGEVQRECGLPSADTPGLVSFLLGAREAQIALLLTERADGAVDVGLRSVPGVDVSAVAMALGGGGHRQAAGCTLPGPLGTAREVVLALLAAVLPARLRLASTPLGNAHAATTASLPAE